MPYKIINWTKWQSRTDRERSPWIKLWKDLLLSDDFFDLPVNIRWQWPCLLLLAQNLSGIIDKTDKQIARQFNIDSFDAKPFLGRFLEDIESGNQVVAKKNQVVFSSVSVSSSVSPSGSSSVSPPLSPSNKKRNSKRSRIEYPQDFIEFWEISPKTGSKKRAAAKWIKCGPEMKADIFTAMLTQTKWRMAWAKADPGHFIPNWKDMERWIRDERFNDELEWPEVKSPPSVEPHRQDDWPNQDVSDAEMAKFLGVSEADYVAEKQNRK